MLFLWHHALWLLIALPMLIGAYVVTNVIILSADVSGANPSSYVWTQYVFLALYLLTPWTPASGRAAAESGTAAR